MDIRIWKLSFLIGLVWIGTGTAVEARENDPAVVDSLLSVVADTTVSLKARIKVAREAVDYGRTGRAMHALGRLYTQEGKAMSPTNAERWLQRAIETDRENADYRASYAELFWAWNRRTYAYKHAKRAIELDPNHVGALYMAGRHEMWQMTRYLDAERVDRTYDNLGNLIEKRIDLSEYGEESRDRAIGYLTRALEVDSDHWSSRRILGLVYHEARMYGDLVSLFKAYTGRHPENSDGHFFLGLGYQEQEKMALAHRAYVKGLAQMPETAQRFMMSVFLVVDKEEEEAGKPADLEAIRRFWTGRDPLFMTAVNERLMEHCRRVAYVNLRFASDKKGEPGWATDRGQAYIRYGAPVSRSANPAEINTGVDQPGWVQEYLAWQAQTGLAPVTHENRKELWAYEGFLLIFENPDTRDAWRFQLACLGGYPMGFEDLVERVPEHYVDPFSWERYEAPYQTAQFREGDGKTRLEVYYALPGEYVEHETMQPGLVTVDVRQGLFLFDAGWDTVRHEIVRVKAMPFIVYDTVVGTGYMFASERMMLGPGDYYLAAEVEDRKTDTVGTFRGPLEIRDFGGDSLQVSSLLLARRIIERDERPFGRDRFMVLPNPLKRCRQDDQAAFYFEVYNLMRDEFGATHYRISYQMRRLPETPTADEPVPEWTTAVSYTYRQSREWEPHQLALDLDTTVPGRWDFRVEVYDLQNETQAMASTTFRVIW